MFCPLELRLVPAGHVVEDQPAGMAQTVRVGRPVLEMKTGRVYVARPPTKEVPVKQD
ncbi:hypothetical protein RA2_04055 [Roseovarius sp. A-2]|uniref:hypothetical protein n=1 Tax=Roseovarius sp. A-2 TaxID=1570360 RepID=UPI0009C8E984|nr:hypothetical protein [Roseovarius sp. A-2]GAW36980.1 hypothetical protein RA2_04055 [Roseovarius sp. A-2]